MAVVLWVAVGAGEVAGEGVADVVVDPGKNWAVIGTPTRVEVTQSHMGMAVVLRGYAVDAEVGRLACRAAFARVAALNQIFSSHEPESELSRLVRRAGAGPVPVSAELFEVLSAAKEFAEYSDGLLDPTAAPVVRLWRAARAAGRRPDAARLAEAMGRVGHRHLILDSERGTAELRLPGMALDLGAIAKGYIGDQALAVLREKGMPQAMFAAGGDMVFGAPPPGATGWPVQPDVAGWPALRLAHTAAAISGDAVQHVLIDGRRYGHVIDPRRGEPILTRRACLVTAPTGLVADPLATLGTLMPEPAFCTLAAEAFPHAAVRLAEFGAPFESPASETTP